MIPWDVAEILGYDPARFRERVKLTTASGTEKAPLISVNKVRAMEFEVEDVAVVCHDLPPESAVDGLLGLAFLKHFNTDLPLKNGGGVKRSVSEDFLDSPTLMVHFK